MTIEAGPEGCQSKFKSTPSYSAKDAGKLFRLSYAKYDDNNKKQLQIVTTAPARILTTHRLSIPDLLVKERNYRYEIQPLTRALSSEHTR